MTPADLEKYRETMEAAGLDAREFTVDNIPDAENGTKEWALLKLAHSRGERIKEMEKRIETLEKRHESLKRAYVFPWPIGKTRA